MNIQFEYVRCNLCGSSDTKLLFEARERVYKTHILFSYVQCKKCSLVYQNPRPTYDSMKKYFFEDVDRFNTMGVGRFVQGVYRLYYRLERPMYSKQKGSVLDVGAGIGRLLEVYKRKGWDVKGVDISADACAYARENWGIDMHNGYLREAGLNGASFERVCMWQFVEHCDDPLGVLQEAYRILKPGGELEIGEVVNVESFEFKLFKQECVYIAAPIHFYLYTPRSITDMVKKAGFRIVKTRHDCLNPLLLSGSFIDVMDQLFHLGLSHTVRQNISYLVFLALVPFTFLLSALKKSTTMTVYAQKP